MPMIKNFVNVNINYFCKFKRQILKFKFPLIFLDLYVCVISPLLEQIKSRNYFSLLISNPTKPSNPSQNSSIFCRLFSTNKESERGQPKRRGERK